MEVGVRVEAEELLTSRRRHTNSCYLTFVAVDQNGRPIEIPGIIPETPDEKRRYQALDSLTEDHHPAAGAAPGQHYQVDWQ